MDNLVKFLLEYYIWILIVLGIVIVTIIGFLVDSKQKRKKKEESLISSEVKTVEPLPEVNNQDSAPIVDSVNQPVPETTDSLLGENNAINNFVQPQTEQQLQQQPVNAIKSHDSNNQNISLSEQMPHFDSSNVNPVYNASVDNIVEVPKPVNPVSISQPIGNTTMQYQHAQNVQPTVYSQMPSGINQQSTNNMMQQPQQNMYSGQVATQNIGNYSNNYQQPIQQQAVQNVQPTMYSQLVNYGQVTQQPQSNVVQQPQTVAQPAPSIPLASPNMGMNFVTDENTKPSNDDTWEL